MAGISSGGGVSLTEDLMESILQRLPTASCIARFRCVCRSWRVLLSDPQFILKILFFPNNSDDEESSLQILITGGGEAATPYEIRRHRYSLLSYDTLRPVSAPNAEGDLPSSDRLPCPSLTVAGNCDGIFCIVDTDPNIEGAPDVILWNPATSETKLLPASTAIPRRTLYPHQQITGFGFDPQTNDYKVARILYFGDAWQEEMDDPSLEPLTTITYAEVYSLRNGSWKSLTINGDLIPHLGYGGNYVHPQQQRDNRNNSQTQRRQHCYWFYALSGVCFSLSFDMTEEVFESTFITLPPPLRGKGMASIGCFVLKDALHTMFHDCSGDCENYSVWCILKLEVAESWIRLYTFTSHAWIVAILQVWKEDRYICSRQSRGSASSQPHGAGEKDGVYIFSPSTGKYGDLVEIQGRTHPFQAHIFTPTQVSLSDFG
ncbi:unnamed protein product [Linum tenue]|uniref:F-box domain-containing protein n=1 Tax=Linum tenue TaxID=586396 RepID=A0AAV0IJM3_9ROSI|nr:unnamed protein product [Linum tenue]